MKMYGLALMLVLLSFGVAHGTTTSPYAPRCSVSATTSAPNQPITFVPSPPPSLSGGFTYRWIGQASTTSIGTTTLSFIYPGEYTVVLEARGTNGIPLQALCPPITVAFNATTYSNTGAFYPFPFNSSSTKPLIPKEDPASVAEGTCLNLVQNLSYGYEDDVKNKEEGIIYALQKFLKEKGYLKVDPTGYFGNLTRSAVRAFQSANKIESTGFVGPFTRGQIKAISCDI